MNLRYIATTIAIIAITTLFIRVSLFSLFQGKSVPKIITYLGNALPYCIMPILVLYCIRNTAWSSVSSVLPTVIALTATAAVHLIRKNTILSVVVGTAAYMILLHVF